MGGDAGRARDAVGLLVLGVLLCLAIGSALAQLPDRTNVVHGPVRAPVVVIGVAGLAWGDIRDDQTPRLYRLLGEGAATGAATVKAAGRPACAADGWLSLSAGQFAAGPRVNEDKCGPLPAVRPAGGSGRVTGWQDIVDAQRGSEFSPHPGLLGEALTENGGCATAVGPGAALALADGDGTVARYRPAFGGDALRCPVTIIDGGQVVEPGAGRLNSLAGIDRFVGQVLDQAGPNATVLIQGVTKPPRGTPELGVTVLAGPATAGRTTPRLLTVTSTRWDGVVRLLDVPSTLLDAVGAAEPEEFSGAPIAIGGPRPADPTATAHRLGDITATDQTLRRWSGVFLNVAVALQVLLYAAAFLMRSGRRRRLFVAAALPLAGLPVAVYLVTLTRWWRAPLPDAALWAGIAVIASVVAVAAGLLSDRLPWRVPLAVSLLTFGVLVVDALTGTELHRASPFGPSALYGGRYYGFGNSTFAVFSVAALVLAGALAAELRARTDRAAHAGRAAQTAHGADGAGRAAHADSADRAGRAGRADRAGGRAAVGAVAVVGGVALVVDVWPAWGADVGGGIALVPGLVVLIFGVAGIRLTAVRLALAGAAGLATVAAVGLADWTRPPAARTHAGRFVQDVLDGDALALIGRKAGYALESLTGGWLAWVTAAALLAALLAVARPARFRPAFLAAALHGWPELRPTLAAVLVTSLIGAVVNDYGIRVVTFAFITLLPLVALTCARAATTPDADGAADGHAGQPARATAAAGDPPGTPAPPRD